MGELDRANDLYERAMFHGDSDAIPLAERELDALEAGVALARGRILHARFITDRVEDPRELALFDQAAKLYGQLGDVRGEAEALFWVGIVHQVVRDDTETALPYLSKSYELATKADDKLTLSYATRHLAFADMDAGRLDSARERFEESVRLRREINFQPGLAAAVLALADCANTAGEHDRAAALLDEAQEVAEACGASAVLGWIEQTRSRIALT